MSQLRLFSQLLLLTMTTAALVVQPSQGQDRPFGTLRPSLPPAEESVHIEEQLMRIKVLSGDEGFEVRDNGEVSVKLPGKLAFRDGKIYSVGVVFRNFIEYDKVVALGRLDVGFDDLDAIFYRKGQEMIALSPGENEELTIGLAELLANVTGTVCGSVVVRGMVMVQEDLPMVIDLSVRNLFSSSQSQDLVTPPNSSQLGRSIPGPFPGCVHECDTNISNACPVFAILGACNESCVSICQDNWCIPRTFHGTCTVLSLPLLPDPCFCNVTTSS
jgi:hypothetical protein